MTDDPGSSSERADALRETLVALFTLGKADRGSLLSVLERVAPEEVAAVLGDFELYQKIAIFRAMPSAEDQGVVLEETDRQSHREILDALSEQERHDVIGEMPSGRRPFTVSGATEPETFADAERGRAEVCRLARSYFADRDRYVRDYEGQCVLMDASGVLLHAPVGEMTGRAIAAALGGDPFKGYSSFLKLVLAEEAELEAPYVV